jgi:hypothetical protein
MVATNCSLTGRTNQQRYKVACGAAEFAESNPQNWSHGEQIVIVNARRPGFGYRGKEAANAAFRFDFQTAEVVSQRLAAQIAPELCMKHMPSIVEGAGKAGCPVSTRSLACKNKISIRA